MNITETIITDFNEEMSELAEQFCNDPLHADDIATNAVLQLLTTRLLLAEHERSNHIKTVWDENVFIKILISRCVDNVELLNNTLFCESLGRFIKRIKIDYNILGHIISCLNDHPEYTHNKISHIINIFTMNNILNINIINDFLDYEPEKHELTFYNLLEQTIKKIEK